MKDALLLYCVEDTNSLKRANIASFFNSDFIKLSKCTNVFIHYHNSTNVHKSVEIVIKNMSTHIKDINHSLDEQGFDVFMKRAMRQFPEKEFNVMLVFQSHCWIDMMTTYVTNPKKNVNYLSSCKMVEIVQKYRKDKIIAVIFDCCYMSTLENAKYISLITDYMVACESSSPYFGFIACARDIDKYIHMKPMKGLRHIIDDCIKYNNSTKSLLPYPTDGVLWYLPALKVLKNSHISKLQSKYKIDNLRLYDLYRCLDMSIDISKLIIYNKRTKTTSNIFMKGIAISSKEILNKFASSME
jgi:hypothetical protein